MHMILWGYKFGNELITGLKLCKFVSSVIRALDRTKKKMIPNKENKIPQRPTD